MFLPFFISSFLFLKSNYTNFQSLPLSKNGFDLSFEAQLPIFLQKSDIRKNLVTSAIFSSQEQVDYKNGENSSLSGETKKEVFKITVYYVPVRNSFLCMAC